MPAHLIDHLRDRLREPLPGPDAQYRMAHLGREFLSPAPPDARRAGVMALFYPSTPNTEDWHLVLIERVRKDGDRHSGQVSFPGGKHEKHDPDLWATALRETEEEVGVARSSVEQLGSLTPLFIPISHFLVHPFVGFTVERPDFRAQETEVSSILEVPLDRLSDPVFRKTTDLTMSNGLLLRDVPYFDVNGYVVWGATAMMLSELLEVAIQ